MNIITEGITLSKIERQILVQFVGEWIDDCYADDEESLSKFIDSCWYKINNTRNNAILTKLKKMHKVLQMNGTRL